MPCAICRRESRGFLWQDPVPARGEPAETVRFCSFRCQTLFGQRRARQAQRRRRPHHPETPMIDATETEKAAMAAALRPLGDYVATQGLDRPLAAYSRAEILTLIEIVVDAFQAHLLEVAEREAEREAALFRRLDERRSTAVATGEPF